jgi:hypothetical protein
MKVCDKCKVAHVFLFYAPSNEFLCLECAQQTIQDILVVFHDVITSMNERAEARQAVDGERAEAEFKPNTNPNVLDLNDEDHRLLREMKVTPS